MTGDIKTTRKLNAQGDWVLIDHYFIDGREVTKKKFLAAFPDREIGQFAGPGTSTYPHESMAVGVHPRQVKEAAAHAKKVGVPTEFTADGKAIMRDREHRRKYLRAMGAHDRNAYGRV